MTAQPITFRQWQNIKQKANYTRDIHPVMKIAAFFDKMHYYELVNPEDTVEVVEKPVPITIISPIEIIAVEKPAILSEVSTLEPEVSTLEPVKKKVKGVDKNALKIGDRVQHTVTMKIVRINNLSDKHLIRFPENWELLPPK